MKTEASFQECNLDIGGRMIWLIAPVNEISKKESPPFIVAEAGRFFARSRFFYRRRAGKGSLFLYTQSGKGLLKYKGGEYELTPGGIALIDCRQSHEYRTYDSIGGDWTFYWIYFYGECVGFFERLIYRDSFCALNVGDALQDVFEAVLKNLQFSSRESLFLLNDSVYKILARMTESPVSQESPEGGQHTTKRIIEEAAEYIKTNHWQPLVLEDVAKSFGLSKYHFLRVFKEFTGMTPYKYLITERVSVAKKLLQTTDMKIFEISIMVGFADESNFIRTFKAISGMTPKAYRLNMK